MAVRDETEKAIVLDEERWETHYPEIVGTQTVPEMETKLVAKAKAEVG